MGDSTLSRNCNLIQSNILSSILTSSVVVKSLLGLLTVFYFCSFSQTLFEHLCVIPGFALPPNFWVWTLLTHSFLQPHLVLLLVDICVIILSGKLLEPLWGALQMGLFFTIVTVSSATLTALVYMIVYYATGNPDYLFETTIYGLGAYIGGFCVAVKQLMPDHVLITLPFGKLRNKHIPLLMLSTALVLKLANVLNGPYPLLFGFGVVISWIYLRFYQKHSNGSRGDLVDNFSFASFFPAAVEPGVAILSNFIYKFLVKIKVCKKPQRKYDVSSPTTITVTLPGTDPADAERRRQLAIKALHERLNKSKEETIWPTSDDEEDTDLVSVAVHSPQDPVNKTASPQASTQSASTSEVNKGISEQVNDS